MRLRKLLTLIAILGSISLDAQNIGINNDNPDSSAVLDIQANDRGLLIPRLTSAQREGILSPAEGLMVFDTDKSAFAYFSDGAWHLMVTTEHQDEDWGVTGTDDIYNLNSGNVGIGTSSPTSDLHINDATGNAEIRLGNSNGSDYIVGIDEAEGVLNLSPDNGSGNVFVDSTGSFGLEGPAGIRFIVGIDEAEGVLNIGSSDSVAFEDTQILTIGRMGNVGVGVPNPETALHLGGDAGPVITFSDSISTRNIEFGFSQDDASFGLFIDSSLSGGSRKSVMKVEDNGGVSFGTTLEPREVDISGELTVKSIQLGGSIEDAIVGSDGTTLSNRYKPKYIELYNTTSVALNETLTDMVWEKVRGQDAIYTFSPGTSEVTMDKKGTYEITLTATVNGGTFINTAESRHELHYYDGIAYDEVPGSAIWIANEGVPVTASRTIVLEMNAGDRIKIQSVRNAITASTVSGGFGLVIKRLYQ